MFTAPAFAADGVTGITGVRWGKNVFNFENMPSGPQSLRNLSRRPDGTGNAGQLVGDYEKREGTVGGDGRDAGYHPDASLKGLQLELTMEDRNVFTAPLTVRVTYRRLVTEYQENVCPDNPVEHYKDEWIGLPRAERPDF
jgi:hypothetical protein